MIEPASNPFPPPAGTATSPAPSDQEAVAIAAAMEALWPRPVMETANDADDAARSWRFSGRWWNKPVAARRHRPFR